MKKKYLFQVSYVPDINNFKNMIITSWLMSSIVHWSYSEKNMHWTHFHFTIISRKEESENFLSSYDYLKSRLQLQSTRILEKSRHKINVNINIKIWFFGNCKLSPFEVHNHSFIFWDFKSLPRSMSCRKKTKDIFAELFHSRYEWLAESIQHNRLLIS